MTAAFGGGGPTFIKFDTYAAGKYILETPELEQDLYDLVYGSAPGVNGCYSINFGFRSKGITLPVVYISATEDGCVTTFKADTTAINGPVDLTIAGMTFKRCFGVPASTKNGNIQKLVNNNQDIVYYMPAVIKVSSKGASA